MCTIDMAVDPSNNATVALIPGQLSMKQDLDMAIFYITNWNWNQRSEDLRMSITMKRKVISELMTTFFPTLLLTAITFATTFFKPIFFEAALSVNLTTMLVMTTIFISKMESLPPTSYIKMIDIWLILCQMVPFAEVVLLTGMEYYRRDANHEEKSKKNITEDDMEGKHCQKCWSPDLKTLGRFVLLMLQSMPFKLKTISGRIISTFSLEITPLDRTTFRSDC